MPAKLAEVVASVLMAATALALASGRTDEAAARPSLPRYNAQGELLRPEGYRTWVFVGADLGLDYSQATIKASTIRKRRTRPRTTAGLSITSTLIARPTSILREPASSPTRLSSCSSCSNRGERSRGISSLRGLYEGNRVALEVAVKDRERPDGAKTPWAYYDFTGQPGPQVAASANQPGPNPMAPASTATSNTPTLITSGCSSTRPCAT